MNVKAICAAVLAAVLLLATNCFAGDFATLNVIGFSKDGRYLAFEEFGTLDGSGFPYSSIYFIDTAKNIYAARVVEVRIEKETASEASARNRSAVLAAKRLKLLGIVRGNTGKLVVSHLLTDLTFENKRDKPSSVIRFAEEIGSMYRSGNFELSLTQVPVNTKDCESFQDETQMIELKLTNREDDTFKFLQKDTTLPPTRGCALDYDMQYVYLYKEFAAVFVGVYTRGFEGPDMRFIAVTGKLR